MGSCPGGSCPGGSSPQDSCQWGSCPQGSCPVTVPPGYNDSCCCGVKLNRYHSDILTHLLDMLVAEKQLGT